MPARPWWVFWIRSVGAMVLSAVVLVVVVDGIWLAGVGGRYRSVTGASAVPTWWNVTGAAVALGCYALLVRLTERRAVTELALGPSGRELAAGAGLGIAAFVAVIVALVAAGAYRIGPGPGLTTLGAALSVSLLSAVFEELLVRGIILRRLITPMGGWGALAFSAVIFGAGHLGNPNATLGGALAIAVEAGVLLGAAYLLTQRLWLPIGLHVAWNFTESGVFGVRLSGIDVVGSVWRSTPVAGHDVLSGGAFGAEASPLAVVACLAVAVPMLLLAHRRGRIVPPAWAKRTSSAAAAPAAGSSN